MQEKLAEYARLVVRVGVNLQRGQTLVLGCPVECASFGRMVAQEAYEAGAREVVVSWNDDAITRMKYLQADDAVFDEMPAWLKAFHYGYAEQRAAKVIIAASDPENLKGVSPDRIRRSTVTQGNEMKEYQQMQMANEFPWCIVSIPTAAWASKVFPDLSAAGAIDKLWDAILHTMRITGDGGAVDRWAAHVSRLNERVEKLNQYHFSSLVYRNSLGTDLTVDLPDRHLWMAGQDKAKTGVTFVANMPTEEIFTLPERNGVNGTLYSSMPLSLNGNLVTDMRLVFKDGKVVDVDAGEGLEHLVTQLDADEGARYLGEVALVPASSPISQQGILYYNTLFDENASCHFAFGKAYPAFDGADSMTQEDLAKNGANDSIIHVDFMVGTPDLSITGITADGQEIAVFENGEFAF